MRITLRDCLKVMDFPIIVHFITIYSKTIRKILYGMTMTQKKHNTFNEKKVDTNVKYNEA